MKEAASISSPQLPSTNFRNNIMESEDHDHGRKSNSTGTRNPNSTKGKAKQPNSA